MADNVMILPDCKVETVKAGIKLMKRLFPTLNRGAINISVKQIAEDLDILNMYTLLQYDTSDFLFWGDEPLNEDNIIPFKVETVSIGDL